MNKLKNIGNQTLGAGRQLYLAGLGVAVMGGERTVKVFNGLVDKGRAVSEKRQDKERATTAKLTAKITGLRKAAGERVQNGINGIFGRLGIPSRDEIRDLTRSVEQLTAKVAAVQPKLAD